MPKLTSFVDHLSRFCTQRNVAGSLFYGVLFLYKNVRTAVMNEK